MADQPPAHPLANPYGGRGPTIMGVSWAQASLALILMILRTYTNAFLVKSFRWDYFWAVLTLVTGLITQAILTRSVAWGLGNHIELLEPTQIVDAIKWIWIGQCLLIQCIGFGKYAVIAFLLRIQDRAQSRKTRYQNYFLYFIGVSNFIINITEMAMILTSCSPTAKFWDSNLRGNCSHVERTNHVGYFQGSWAAFSDVLLAAYPVLVFWNLKISAKLKVGLCCLMGGGLLAAAAGVAKTIYIKLIAVEADVTYAISPLIIWAWTENWLVLILGALPSLRPLFVRVFQRISTNNSRRRNRSSGYYPQSDQKSIPMYPPASKRGIQDTDSERNILSGGTGILRTTHVQVLSNPSDSREDSNDSLNAVERGTAYGAAL